MTGPAAPHADQSPLAVLVEYLNGRISYHERIPAGRVRRDGSPSAHRSMEHLLMAHGKLWWGSAPASDAEEGVPKLCFGNATQLALSDPSLTYVEGLAITPAVPVLPFHHAWCVTPDGLVVDPTWLRNQAGAVYLGVALTTRWHRQWQRKRLATEGTSVLDDWGRDWPALQDGLPAEALADIPGHPVPSLESRMSPARSNTVL